MVEVCASRKQHIDGLTMELFRCAYWIKEQVLTADIVIDSPEQWLQQTTEWGVIWVFLTEFKLEL